MFTDNTNVLMKVFNPLPGQRQHDIDVPHFAPGDDTNTVPIGFDRYEVDNLPTLPGTMTVESEPGAFSIAIELGGPSQLMAKLDEDGSSVEMSSPIDGLVMRVTDTGVTGYGVRDEEEVELFPDLPQTQREAILDDFAARMMLVDHERQ